MADDPAPGRQEGAQEPSPLPFDALPTVHRRRRGLWLLIVPGVLYCAAPLVANSIEPRILGVPFLLAWIIAVTLVSPVVIWVAARLDPGDCGEVTGSCAAGQGAARRRQGGWQCLLPRT